ncbi:glycosyltransferase family 4 protein [Patescibacteria group bacterium]|nr:glycosyltransferase family 4 protein [Patescibacteria group bacterium]MBU1015997.1 glycosyltransferase family 4 protein [Patescibacteria group bacterium]MBU1684794.1 glycosyltransferase family 4 protein [Patescibacteria group bacterium]MBU1938764.1 glycosyltransferase family 4 protein [Patescibacteria group bacterium]
MKHILFYTDTPNLGGAEKHMLLLAKYLSAKEVQVSLAYGRYSKISKLHAEFARYCKQIFVLSTLHKHDPRHYSQLRKILAKNKFDLIHLHLWNPGSCRYAFFAASKTSLPIVTTEHDPFELTGIKRLVKKSCLAKTNRTIVISMDNFRLLDEFYGVLKERLELVHNGIEIDRFLDNRDKAELPVQKGAQIITCIAELHHRKGHRYLLEAFKRLQTHVPRLHLVLVGSGQADRELRDQASQIPNVHFVGWREDIPQILRASDILVLPSLKEAFGQVILEAMASGVITVATNNGGIPDIIKDGVTGYLVPPANSQIIADRIATILTNPDQKRDIEKAALATVKANFTAQKMADKTLAVYQKVW